jgi:H+/Cl- antiporter ClcA
LLKGSPLSLSDGCILKFSIISEENENALVDLPSAIIIGIITGLMGALFVHVSTGLGIWRKKFVNSYKRKVFECVVFAFVTSSAFYAVVVARKNNCRPLSEGSQSDEFSFTCGEGFYNPFATLVFNTEGGTIR